MNFKRFFARVFALACWPILCCGTGSAADIGNAETLSLGVAALEITPGVGDADRRDAGTKVLDPLWAKAMVFRQGDRRAALVFCDVIGVSIDLSDAARKLAAESSGIPRPHICIAATHTHTGRLSPQAQQQAVERIARAVVQAQAAAQPVRLETATGRQEGLSFNRRFLMRDGSVRMNPGFRNPDIVRPVGVIDPEVNFLVARRLKDNRPLASLTVFAMHLDTVGGGGHSADYPYFLEQHLREKFGREFLSLFGTGTCGDINHFDVSKPGPQKGHQETTRRLGRTLATTVMGQWSRLKDVGQPNLAVRSRILQVPLQEYTDKELTWANQPEKDRKPLVPERPFLQRFRAHKIRSLAAMRKRWGEALPMEVQVFRLGDDLAVVTLPGEVFVDLGLAIKRTSPFGTTMVIELANNSPAYIPTRNAFEQGDYEVVNSRVKPGGGEMLVEAAGELLRELKEKSS